MSRKRDERQVSASAVLVDRLWMQLASVAVARCGARALRSAGLLVQRDRLAAVRDDLLGDDASRLTSRPARVSCT